MREHPPAPSAFPAVNPKSTAERGGWCERVLAHEGLQPDDRRVRRILEVMCVDEAELAEATVHQHRVRARAAGEKADALQEIAVGHAGRDETHVAPARQI